MSSLQDIAARVGLSEETLSHPCEEDHYRSLANFFQPWQELYSDLLSGTDLDDVRGGEEFTVHAEMESQMWC